VTLPKVNLVDSHCHVNDPKFDEDRDAVIERALAAGVAGMLVIDAPEFAERYPFMYATIGVHPHEAANATEETFARMRDLASHPKVVAIGEIGLDYHYDFAPRDVQHRVFDRQLEIAAQYN
jgi:TatD DNase family protein